MSKTLLLRSSGSPTIGTGHLRRCRAISLEALRRGWATVLVVDELEVEWVSNSFASDSFSTIVDPMVAARMYGSCDLIVLDSYNLQLTDPIFEIACPKVVSISDNETPEYPVNFSVDQDFPRIKPVKVGNVVHISAPIVSSEFTEARRTISLGNRAKTKIVITGGGHDLTNYCQAISNCLVRINLDFSAVCFSSLPLVSLDSRFIRHHPGPEYLHAMRSADLVFSASGTSIWELLSARVPFGFGLAARNQTQNYAMLTRKKIGFPVGIFDGHMWNLDEHAINRSVLSRNVRRLMTLKMQLKYKPIPIADIFSLMSN